MRLSTGQTVWIDGICSPSQRTGNLICDRAFVVRRRGGASEPRQRGCRNFDDGLALRHEFTGARTSLKHTLHRKLQSSEERLVL